MPESSLRTPRRAPTRKPTIQAPLPGGQQPVPRGGPKSRVDDRIKKRMSMRYAELVTSPTDMSIPPVPGLPGRGGGEGGMMNLGATMGMLGEDVARDRAARAALDDKRILEDERFDPEAFLKLKLANSTEAELRSLQSSLRSAKEDIHGDLQRNVFKNYAEFVLISKEITSLESEMLELKDLLSEYKSMPSLLHIPDPTTHSANPSLLSTYKRSSVADLRIMYFNQMQELHAHIEGAAKFAPTTPGRHVVAEVEGVLSLNAATYKVVGRVRFVVLDDLVLVARRRRRKAAAGGEGGGGTVNEGKLVAERCWPLSEMLVLDTKDSARMTNVFKIRHGKETHVYRTETAQDKKSLLAQFRSVAEELAAKKRKEREGEHERRKSMWQAGGGDSTSYAPMPEWMADLASRGGEIPGVEMEAGAKEKAERDARWVGEWADDLTVAIALREWEKAVSLVEEGKAKFSTIPLLAHKLPPLSAQLTAALLASLALPSARKSTSVALISFLLRLKAGPAARSTFLQMRSGVLKGYVRKIRFDGNVGTYVGDLAVVYFTGIKHTADWFLASFKENEVASAFIDWAKKQIEDFAETFRKQVFTSDVEPEVVEGALKITYTQSKKLLQEYGLDFRFLLDELLVPKPKEKPQPLPQFTFPDYQMPKIEPVPASRRRGAPPSTTNLPPPTLQVDSLAPPPSATSIRSPSSPSNHNNTPLLSAPPLSGYSTASNYSNATHNPYPSAMSVSFNVPPPSSSRDRDRDGTRTPISAAPPRSRTPASAAPPRARTPISAAPPRVRTPVSAAPPRVRTPVSAAPPRARTPASAAPPPMSAPAYGERGDMPLVSPVPRRTRGGERERGGGEWERERERERERDEERAARSSPAPPPRSMNRPGSTAGQRLPPPVAVPQREGMI
ncbi:Exocyst complex component EXO84 [Hypsizygus marmoreus]|uniref:Exocyst complex component EXO84 n=1 Tax=Hypsizygus marmoreus TaxID=39966 RepID=A0A369JB54_HYPMA|nr:Exocyst complex component EXO84 [Hypsizygus marmoreus]